MAKHIAALAAIVVFVASACFAQNESNETPVAVSSPETGQTIDANEDVTAAKLTVGDSLVITLRSNRTTGYEWQLSAGIDEDMLEFLSSAYEVAETGMIGSGGVEKWAFKTKAAGETMVVFKYVRPWEKDFPPAKEAVFSISIK